MFLDIIVLYCNYSGWISCCDSDIMLAQYCIMRNPVIVFHISRIPNCFPSSFAKITGQEDATTLSVAQLDCYIFFSLIIFVNLILWNSCTEKKINLLEFLLLSRYDILFRFSENFFFQAIKLSLKISSKILNTTSLVICSSCEVSILGKLYQLICNVVLSKACW